MKTLLEYYNLHNHSDLEVVEYNSDAEWLDLRKKGIGGSDVAAIMQLSKYMSPLKLYKIKIGELEDDLSDNVFVKKGKDLEYLIRDKYVSSYMHEKGYIVRHPEFMMINKQVPWLRANIDGIAIPIDLERDKVSDNIIIEIKWVSEYAEQSWYGDDYCGIPSNYYAQVQHYMTVTGARKAMVCALFDSDWSMHYFEVPYNAAFAGKLIDQSREFYYGNVMGGIEPKPIPSMDKSWMADALKRVPKEPTMSEEMAVLCEEYSYKKSEAKTITEECSKLQDEIVTMYLDGKYPTNGWKVKVTECVTSSISATKLKEENPELYEKCRNTTSYTRTTIRR